MPLSKDRQLEYQRQRRLRGRTCEGCGVAPAKVHHQAALGLRTIAVCASCETWLASKSTQPPKLLGAHSSEAQRCRKCGDPADVGVYCRKCADDLLVRSMDPQIGGRRKKGRSDEETRGGLR